MGSGDLAGRRRGACFPRFEPPSASPSVYWLPFMRFVDVIARKRDGYALTREEITAFVGGVQAGSIPDYQTSALLMAVVLRGMNGEETAWLTDAMLRSGDRVDL